VAKGSSTSDGGAGQHFVPASLLPYGGFGDPDTPAPYWKPGRSVDPHKLALSKAQDRFMRVVRTYLRDAGISDDAFEQQLGYRRYGLSRKLNGQELMTMRDLLRVSEIVPSALAALAVNDRDATVVAQHEPVFRKAKTATTPFHESLQTAVESLEEAADHLRQSATNRDADFEPALRSLAEVINDIGRAIVGRKNRR
jgi:hypothetical protein